MHVRSLQHLSPLILMRPYVCVYERAMNASLHLSILCVGCGYLVMRIVIEGPDLNFNQVLDIFKD